MSRVFEWETWVQSEVKAHHKLKKWYLIPPCLTLSIKGKVGESSEYSSALPYISVY